MKKKLNSEKEDRSEKENQDLKTKFEKDKFSNDFRSWFYNIGLKS